MDKRTVTALVHHTLTVVAFILIPMVWVFMNVFAGRTTLYRVYTGWNEQRLSNEPWGVLDREF